MSSLRAFRTSVAWQMIVTSMRAEIETHLEAALTAEKFSGREYERGWVDALRSFIELPETLEDSEYEENGEDAQKGQNDGQNDEEKEADQKEKGVISFARTPRRTGFFRG